MSSYYATMAMKNPSLITLLLLSFLHLAASAAELDPELTGTWTTKSQKVLTGPGFYDSVKDEFKEPELPGISYSFTSDGFYEEAYYRATSDPVQPECAGGIMQFQHGNFTKGADGVLHLTPFAEDGRELVSNPCKGKMSTYTLYNQTETFKRYEVGPDPFNGVLRLNLYKWDGSPMIPMFLAYKPPQMLPTKVLNPLITQESAESPTGSSKFKRFQSTLRLDGSLVSLKNLPFPGCWCSVGLVMVAFGGIVFIASS